MYYLKNRVLSVRQSLMCCYDQKTPMVVFVLFWLYVKQPESLRKYIIHMQSRNQNIMLLRSPLYFVGNCPRHTAEDAREEYSGCATAHMQNTPKTN
jgi:hypothetical protein